MTEVEKQAAHWRWLRANAQLYSVGGRFATEYKLTVTVPEWADNFEAAVDAAMAKEAEAK